MTRNKAYKIRIYPNQMQRKQICSTIGCCRFVFNQMLAERKAVYERFKDHKEALNGYKYKTERELKAEFPFLAEASSRALQQVSSTLSILKIRNVNKRLSLAIWLKNFQTSCKIVMFENSRQLYFNTCKIKQVAFQKVFQNWTKSR